MILKRLRLALRFRVWPWRIPWQAVYYLSLERPTEADIRWTKRLVKEHGW